MHIVRVKGWLKGRWLYNCHARTWYKKIVERGAKEDGQILQVRVERKDRTAFASDE